MKVYQSIMPVMSNGFMQQNLTQLYHWHEEGAHAVVHGGYSLCTEPSVLTHLRLRNFEILAIPSAKVTTIRYAPRSYPFDLGWCQIWIG